MEALEQRVRKLEDDAAIRDLAAAFADAATRHDLAALKAVWKNDGTFAIGAPLRNVRHGVDEIVAFIDQLRQGKEFFVQFVHSGVIDVSGDRARARWLIREVAKGGDSYYHNYGLFSDVLERIDGRWLFAERAFQYVYLDFSPFSGSTYPLTDFSPLPVVEAAGANA